MMAGIVYPGFTADEPTVVGRALVTAVDVGAQRSILGIESLNFDAPLSRIGNSVLLPAASASQNGYLLAADWQTFNAKQSALGYIAADDASVVKLSGDQTISGYKTIGGLRLNGADTASPIYLATNLGMSSGGSISFNPELFEALILSSAEAKFLTRLNLNDNVKLGSTAGGVATFYNSDGVTPGVVRASRFSIVDDNFGLSKSGNTLVAHTWDGFRVAYGNGQGNVLSINNNAQVTIKGNTTIGDGTPGNQTLTLRGWGDPAIWFTPEANPNLRWFMAGHASGFAIQRYNSTSYISSPIDIDASDRVFLANTLYAPIATFGAGVAHDGYSKLQVQGAAKFVNTTNYAETIKIKVSEFGSIPFQVVNADESKSLVYYRCASPGDAVFNFADGTVVGSQTPYAVTPYRIGNTYITGRQVSSSYVNQIVTKSEQGLRIRNLADDADASITAYSGLFTGNIEIGDTREVADGGRWWSLGYNWGGLKVTRGFGINWSPFGSNNTYSQATDTKLGSPSPGVVSVTLGDGTTLGTLRADGLSLGTATAQSSFGRSGYSAFMGSTGNGLGLFVDGWGQTATFELWNGPLTVRATNGLVVRGAFGSGAGPLTAGNATFLPQNPAMQTNDITLMVQQYRGAPSGISLNTWDAGYSISSQILSVSGGRVGFGSGNISLLNSKMAQTGSQLYVDTTGSMSQGFALMQDTSGNQNGLRFWNTDATANEDTFYMTTGKIANVNFRPHLHIGGRTLSLSTGLNGSNPIVNPVALNISEAGNATFSGSATVGNYATADWGFRGPDVRTIDESSTFTIGKSFRTIIQANNNNTVLFDGGVNQSTILRSYGPAYPITLDGNTAVNGTLTTSTILNDNPGRARLFDLTGIGFWFQSNSGPIELRAQGYDSLKALHTGGVTIENAASPTTTATLNLLPRGAQTASLLSLTVGGSVAGNALDVISNSGIVFNVTKTGNLSISGTFSNGYGAGGLKPTNITTGSRAGYGVMGIVNYFGDFVGGILSSNGGGVELLGLDKEPVLGWGISGYGISTTKLTLSGPGYPFAPTIGLDQTSGHEGGFYLDGTTQRWATDRSHLLSFERTGELTLSSGKFQLGYSSTTPTYRQRMVAAGQVALEVADAAGVNWQTGYRQEYDAGGLRLAFYDATTTVAKQSIAAAATDAATTQALANSIRSILLNLGLVT